MATKTLNVTDQLYQYIQSVSVREPEIFAELRRETAKLPMGHMQISPEQGQFMALLVELIEAKKTLEIGVFTGYSAMAVANVLPEGGHVVACDISKEWTDIAQQYWTKAGVREKIDLRLGPALETLNQLLENGEAESFDFAFIDADKKSYDAYYERILQLLRPGGLMLLDNVLQEGRVADASVNDDITEAIRQLNKKIFADQRVSISLVPMSDGITLVRKR